MRPLLPLLCVLLLSVAARAQKNPLDGLLPDLPSTDLLGGSAEKRKAAAAKRKEELLARKHSMFDAGCGADVDLEKALGFREAIPKLTDEWNQSWVTDCWGYAACMGVEYVQRRRTGAVSPADRRCDPLLTSIAIKLGEPGAQWDLYDKDGKRTGSFLRSDSYQSLPSSLKASDFGRVNGFDCGERGCYCARVDDAADAESRKLSDVQLFEAYYKAQDVVMKHLKTVYLRKMLMGTAAFAEVDRRADRVYADPLATTRLIAAELDSAGLPPLIRSSLDDATLLNLYRGVKLGEVFDAKRFGRTILKQACLPTPLPPIKNADGPPALDEEDRKAIVADPMARAAKMRALFDWINQRLAAQQPVLLSFCSSLIDSPIGDYVGTPKPRKAANSSTSDSGQGCGEHATIIVAKRAKGGSCQYGIRNSWGYYTPANMSVEASAEGITWIPAWLLLQNTYHAGAYD